MRWSRALHDRRPIQQALVHHSDHASRCASIHYSGRLAESGIERSVGSVGYSYDNALAGTIHGLCKVEIIHRRSWSRVENVELATLARADRRDRRRLLSSIHDRPPAQARADYCQTASALPIAA